MKGLCLNNDFLPVKVSRSKLQFCYLCDEMPRHWVADIDRISELEWANVINEIWNACGNLTKNENGQIISLDGLLGACFDIAINEVPLGYHLQRMMAVKKFNVRFQQEELTEGKLRLTEPHNRVDRSKAT